MKDCHYSITGYCSKTLSLQAEFNDVASGLIDLQDAVTISKLASEKNQTPEDFYQQFFESEQKRLRLEEEKTFDDGVGMDTLCFWCLFPVHFRCTSGCKSSSIKSEFHIID